MEKPIFRIGTVIVKLAKYNQNTMKHFIKTSLLLITLTLVACVGPKKLTKNGDKLAEAGIHKEAVNQYIAALNKDRAYIDAQIGLKKSSAAVLSDYQSVFFRAFSTGDNKTAVYTYLEMQKFMERVNKYNADQSIPAQYTQDFEKAKTEYLQAQYEKANNFMGEKNFKAADELFDEIKSIDPNYLGDDLDKLHEIAKLEPHYLAGKDALLNNKPRTAYFAFEKVVQGNPNYKDAKFQMEDALAEAQYPIAVLKFKNVAGSGYENLAQTIQAHFTTELAQNKGPFIKVLDRTNMDQVLNEQYLSMDGWVSGSGAVKTGELLGAKAILSGKLLSVKSQYKSPTYQTQKAYKEIKKKVYDAETKKYKTVTEYKKTTYKSYSASNEVTLQFQFILVKMSSS